MKLHNLVWKELWERPVGMLTSMLAILLGVTALIAIRHVTVFSELEVGRQLETLGANVLVLPAGASLQDYYAADLNGQTLPEEYASTILLAGLTGVEKLSPRLCVPAQLNERQVTLTGILPQAEFEAQAAWQTVALLQDNTHKGCKRAHLDKPEDASPTALTTQRTIQSLGDTEAVVGADIASRFSLLPGASIELLGENFKVLAVLPSSGTIDDSRIFAHLHTVQRLAKTGEVVSAIEVMGCCEDVAGALVSQLGELLPGSRVVTVSQVVQTQVGVNRLMARSSIFVLAVLVLVGGASVGGATWANVRERRREIGTLMALGATPGFVSRLFLLKAAWLGLAGGIGGCLLGAGLAVWLGPHWAGVAVSPLMGLNVAAIVAALAVTLLAAYWPARLAARLDPCTCFQEV